jgi:hypothetical protein
MLTIEFYAHDDGTIFAHSLQTDCPAQVGSDCKPAIASVLGTSSSRDFMKRAGAYTILLDQAEAQKMFTGICQEANAHTCFMGRFHARLRG